MKIKYILFILINFLSLSSCQTQKEEEGLYNEVIEIHDAVMPEMGTVFLLKKELSIKRDSLESLNKNNQIINEIDNSINELLNANESMMQWMRNFNTEFEGNADLSRKEYLEKEKEKILDVQNDFDYAINNTKATLKKINSVNDSR